MLLLGQISFNPPKTQHLSPFKQHPGTPLLGEKSIRLSPISRLAPSAACLGGAPTMKSFSLISQAAVAAPQEQKCVLFTSTLKSTFHPAGTRLLLWCS